MGKILNFFKMDFVASGKNQFTTCYHGKADENFNNIDFELNKAGLVATKRSYDKKLNKIYTTYKKAT